MNRQGSTNLLAVYNLTAQLIAMGAVICFGASAVYAAETTTLDTSPAEIVQDSADTNAEPGTALTDLDMLTAEAPLYEYQLSARPDPFKPFIAPQRVDPNALDDSEQQLTGMQLFEPGQLKLVAIMGTANGRTAMVEDVTQKGYLLKEGVLIGRYGEVTEIGRDQVIVTETTHSRSGEEIKTVVSMKLKKDGEGQ